MYNIYYVIFFTYTLDNVLTRQNIEFTSVFKISYKIIIVIIQ